MALARKGLILHYGGAGMQRMRMLQKEQEYLHRIASEIDGASPQGANSSQAAGGRKWRKGWPDLTTARSEDRLA